MGSSSFFKALLSFKGGSGSTLQELFKLIGLIVVFVLIIVACYWVTRFVGTKQLGKNGKTNFRIIDIHKLSPNQSLVIAKIGVKYFCLGITKDHIETICELREGDFEDFKSGSGSVKSFGEVFSSVLKKKDSDSSSEESSDSINKTE